MKTKIPTLYFSNKSILAALILANFKHQPVITTMQRMPNAAFNQNLERSENLFHRRSKNIETASNEPITYNVNSEHSRNYFQQPMIDDLETNEFELDSIYPIFYHRAHRNGFGRSLYHPQTHSIRDYYRQFVDKKRHSRIFSKNQVMEETPKEFFAPDFNNSVRFSNVMPHILLPVAPRGYKKASSIATADENFDDEIFKQTEKLNVPKKSFNKHIQSLNKIQSNINKDAIKNKNFKSSEVHKQAISQRYDHTDEENGILPFEFNTLYFSKPPNEKVKETFFTSTVQIRVERNSNIENIKNGTLNRFPYNRVYFEKIPSNLNLSWFVYVNCSRDSCLLSNSTNESELLKEGWIIHNCTQYGCSEMYPKTESIRRFIGLILLVFTLCVLKIMVFLLLFYYCRRLSLSRKTPKTLDRSDNEESTFIITEKKLLEENHDSNKNELVNIEKFDFSDSNNRSNNKTLVPGAEKGSKSVTEQQEKKGDTNKEWIPADQLVTTCLVPSFQNKNILIPQKAFKKTVHDITSYAIPKCRKTDRSYIPRLEKRGKDNDRKTGKVETKNAEQNHNVKTPKRIPSKQTPSKNGDILLMNLDDEDNSIIPYHFENSHMLKNKSESFVTIDLNEETQSKL